MSQLQLQHPYTHGQSRLAQLWAFLEAELLRGNAYLLPLRLFIGLGWLRAGVEKLIDPAWIAGDKVSLFFQQQLEANAVYFPFYETLIIQLFDPNRLMLSWIIVLGELLAGLAILTGTLTNIALLGALFMNVNFVLAGVVNPSAFYIVIQCTLLASNAGATLGGDAFLSRYVRSFCLVAQPHFELGRRTIEKWGLLLTGIFCCLAATLIVPYIRDFGPHSIDDPAMLLFILLMLGAVLLGILFIRMPTEQPHSPTPTRVLESQPRNSVPLAMGNATSPVTGNKQVQRQLRYPALLIALYAVLYLTWFSYMIWSDSWHLFATLWPVSLTMTLGSFVAGATAEGGAAIAFPVFTKVLHIASTDARTFGLMIQAVGMTMAGIVILLKGVKVLPRVILWATIGGVVGQVAGAYWLHLPNPYPKILFTFTATVFGIALLISRWGLKWQPRSALHRWTWTERGLFCAIGVCGGAFAAITGSGIDMLTFIVLTLAFGINEKISTPTTVIIMALNSIVGFALHGLVLQDIGVAWNYWLVAIPIVVIGAPLGAVVASRLKRDHIILFLLSLITLELVTTILLVPFSPTAIRVTTIAVALCMINFGGMLAFRQRLVQRAQTDSAEINVTAMTTGVVVAVAPAAPVVPSNATVQVYCAKCEQVQAADNGDCRWCGTSLAFAHPSIQPV